MRKFIIGGLAAIVLALGFTASNASAYWATRNVYRWDPLIGRYVLVAERVWVPDPVVYGPGISVDLGFRRSWYLPRFGDRHEHERHEHHRR
jgi:hypothetical protein